MPSGEQSARTARFLKWIVIILFGLVIILGGGGKYFSKKISPFLAQQLKNQVIRSSDSLYSINFSDFSVNFLTGTIAIRSFQLMPHINTYYHLITERLAPANLFYLNVSELRLRHAHPFLLLFSHIVKIKNLEFDNPDVRIVHRNVERSDTTQSVHKAIANLLSGPLQAIYINRVDLNNISLGYKNLSDTGSKGIQVQDAEVVLKNFKLDQSTLQDTSLFFFTQDCWVHFSNINLPTEDSLYYFQVADASYSTEHEKGIIKNIRLVPRYSESAFDEKIKYRADRYNISIDTILFSGVSPNAIVSEEINIQKLQALGLDADIYLNRGLPPGKKGKLFFQQLIKGSPVLFSLDTLLISNSQLSYRELNPQSDLTGNVAFNNVAGSVYNITNEPAMLAKNNYCRGNFQSLFMNKGKTKVRITMNLTDPEYSFSYSGSLDNMKAKALNHALKPLAMVKINSGEIHQFDFNFIANSQEAKGNVRLLYNGLSIKVLSKDTLTGRLKNKTWISMMANLFVIDRDNITTPGALQRANVTYQRPPGQSMIGYIWKTLFLGIQQIAGILPQQTQNVINEFKGNQLVQKIQQKRASKNSHE